MDNEVKRLEKLIKGMESAKEVTTDKLLSLLDAVFTLRERIKYADELIDLYSTELGNYVSKDADTARKYLKYMGIDHKYLYKKVAGKLQDILKK